MCTPAEDPAPLVAPAFASVENMVVAEEHNQAGIKQLTNGTFLGNRRAARNAENANRSADIRLQSRQNLSPSGARCHNSDPSFTGWFSRG